MRIVHVHHSYYPTPGGIEKVVQKLAEEQARLDHEVHVVTSNIVSSGVYVEGVLNGVYVHRVKALRLHYPDLTVPSELDKKLFKDADVVHVHSQNSLFNMTIAERAKSLGAKIAVHFMAVDALSDHPDTIVRTVGRFYGRWTTLRALSVADLKLVKSLRDMKILERRYGAKHLHYVPDGIDRELLELPSLEEEFRVRYGLFNNVILYVGRLHPLKGVSVLLEAASYVLKAVHDVVFVFVGPGDVKRYVDVAEKLRIRDKTLFLGPVDERVKVAAIDASTCLILPSVCNYAEVYSLVISEAWARGKAVIASSVGEVPYRVKHLVDGIIVPPRDARALADAILTLLEDRVLAKDLGARGREKLITWDEIARISLDLYHNSMLY